jgi:hypothetical protein
MSIIFSDEYPVVVLAFRVRNRGSTWLDGNPVGRIYVEKHEMKQQVTALIEEGRLTLDPEGAKKPVFVSVGGSGGFYAAILEDPEAAEAEQSAATPPARPSMQPVTSYDEERHAIQLIEENRYHEFVELLEAYRQVIREDPDGLNRVAINPMNPWRHAEEMILHGGGASPKGRFSRTMVLIDRGADMAEPWSLWEQYPKIVVARFLANAVAASHPNTAVYSFGQTLRMERSPDDVEPLDAETRMDVALRHVLLAKPERLVILTGGDGCENRENTAGLLDSLSRSGAQTLYLSLGKKGDREWLTSRLANTPGVIVLPLTIGGDVVRMMHGIVDLF